MKNKIKEIELTKSLLSFISDWNKDKGIKLYIKIIIKYLDEVILLDATNWVYEDYINKEFLKWKNVIETIIELHRKRNNLWFL